VAHPRIAVRLEADGRLVDLAREPFDVAIRGGRGEWPGMEAVFLFPSAQTVLATPQAMAALGEAPRPQDLLDTRRIGSEAEWTAWFKAAGVAGATDAQAAAPRIAADTQTLEVAAAIANGGAAMGSPVMFATDIAAGRLVQPFDHYIGRGQGYWLVYPADRRRARKIAAFREWLIGQVANDPAAQRLLAAGSG
jgi:LysR family glycine cleavage system transcriptional activator